MIDTERTGGAGGPLREIAPREATPMDWLAPKLAAVPEELAEAVRRLVDDHRAEADEASRASRVPEALAAAALGEFDRALGPGGGKRALGPGGGERGAGAGSENGSGSRRDAALRLLAADAVLTYAFHAAAELEADVLELADALGVHGALGARLAISGEGGADNVTKAGGGLGRA